MANNKAEPQEVSVDHFASKLYDDQEILYRIADLLEELLKETRVMRDETL